MSNERPSILIVDSNAAFAAILQEGLEQNGEYHTTVAASGDEALEALATDEFDLAIVDLGLTDPDGITLAHALREHQADLRLMLIPLMGEQIPSELSDLNVQGILPKPFFFPELPGRIADALAQNVAQSPQIAEPPTPSEPPVVAESPTLTAEPEKPDVSIVERLEAIRERISEKRMQQIMQAMTGLAQEINAEEVILTCGGGLIAHAGRLSTADATELARVVGENWRTSARVAQILGREQLRFEQSVEGGEHVFYALAISNDVILSAALSAGVPLGMLRHRAKATADAVRRLIELE